MRCAYSPIQVVLIVLLKGVVLVCLCASEAAASSAQLSPEEALDKGLSITALFGGWEPDYTKKSREIMMSYKAVPSLHLYAGGGYADQIYYTRTDVYAKGYYFYENKSYLKLYTEYKRYAYPTDPTLLRPNPDSNSYEDVPDVAIEISHWFSDRFRGSASVEYFRPTFFYDTASHADNVKTGVEAYYITPIDGLFAKVMYALLRDPDPDSTEIKGRNNPHTAAGTATETSVVYRITYLLGGAIEMVKGKWQGEIMYLPNRDLDNSYDYSILANVSYRFTSKIMVRADYVHDKYSDHSNYAGKTAHVYLFSSFYDVTPAARIGAGVKYIELPTEVGWTGFVMLSYKTGVVF